MLPYYVMVIAPCLLFLISRSSQRLTLEKKNRATIWCFFGILLLILMLRNVKVGTDIQGYLSNFKEIRDVKFSRIFERFDFYEKGYTLFLKLTSIFIRNEQLFLALIALIGALPLAKLYESSENALLTISIFIIVPNFTMLFSGIRQIIALALVAISYRFVKEKKLIKFVLIIVVAFLFHQSAILALLLYPVYHMNITKLKMMIISPIFVLCLIFNKPIFEFLLSLSGKYADIYEFEETGAYTMIILFALFLIFSYIAPTKDKLDKETVGLRNILVLVTFLQTFALSNPVAMRMNLYFIMFVPLLMPRIISRCGELNKKAYRFVGLIMISFFIVYYFYSAYSGVDVLQLYPYRVFWE